MTEAELKQRWAEHLRAELDLAPLFRAEEILVNEIATLENHVERRQAWIAYKELSIGGTLETTPLWNQLERELVL